MPTTTDSTLSITISLVDHLDNIIGDNHYIVISKRKLLPILQADQQATLFYAEQYGTSTEYWRLWRRKDWLWSTEHNDELKRNSEQERTLRWKYEEDRIVNVRKAKLKYKRTLTLLTQACITSGLSPSSSEAFATWIVEKGNKELLQGIRGCEQLELLTSDELNMTLDKSIVVE